METTFDQETVERREAEFINFLVSEGVINPKRISAADQETIGELLDRNEEEIVLHDEPEMGATHKIPEEKREKIRVLLGSEEKQDPKEIEKLIGYGKQVLEVLKAKSGFPVTGVMLYGSRMNLQKNPGEKSDLDVAVYTNSRDLLIDTDLQKDKWEEFIRELNLPIEINVNSAYDRKRFSDQLTNTEDFSRSRWVFSPKALVFVGSLFIDGQELRDQQATDYIRQKLSDPMWIEARAKKTKQIEERIAFLIA